MHEDVGGLDVSVDDSVRVHVPSASTRHRKMCVPAPNCTSPLGRSRIQSPSVLPGHSSIATCRCTANEEAPPPPPPRASTTPRTRFLTTTSRSRRRGETGAKMTSPAGGDGGGGVCRFCREVVVVPVRLVGGFSLDVGEDQRRSSDVMGVVGVGVELGDDRARSRGLGLAHGCELGPSRLDPRRVVLDHVGVIHGRQRASRRISSCIASSASFLPTGAQRCGS